MSAPTERQKMNRKDLQQQYNDILNGFVYGYEWEGEEVETFDTAQILDMKNCLDRILLYKQAGWI